MRHKRAFSNIQRLDWRRPMNDSLCGFRCHFIATSSDEFRPNYQIFQNRVR